MLRMAKASKLSPAEIFQKANAYFGPGGLNLKPRNGSPHAHTYEGGGGYVFVSAVRRDYGSDVILESREWEYCGRQFLARI